MWLFKLGNLIKHSKHFPLFFTSVCPIAIFYPVSIGYWRVRLKMYGIRKWTLTVRFIQILRLTCIVRIWTVCLPLNIHLDPTNWVTGWFWLVKNKFSLLFWNDKINLHDLSLTNNVKEYNYKFLISPVCAKTK